jgi:hypothetical protein
MAENQNKDFENMINEICKNIFPNMNLNEEQMKLFTEKFIKKDDGEEQSNSDDNNGEGEDGESNDDGDNSDDDDDNSDDDNSEEDDSNDNDDNSDDDSDDNDDDSNDDDEDIVFDEDDDDEDANFDITNLNLCCNMCGEKIDESSNYVITPCTHFLHTLCIKNKILSDNNKDKDIDAILDKAMDEFLNKEKCEECEDCNVCKNLF